MFEFYFGEIIETTGNAWLTILGSGLGALLGFSGAYFIFRFQRSADIKREKDKRKYEENQRKLEESKRYEEIINFLETSIGYIIRPGLKQAQSIDKLIIILKTEDVLDLTIAFMMNFRVDWFDGIDKVELYNSFKYHFKNDEKNINYFYNQVTGRISIIRYIINNLEKRLFEVRDISKKNDIEPFQWLRDTLDRISDHPANRLDELLPIKRS